MRDREYDRFGPWILEISEADPVPTLFRPHLREQEKAELSFKIPRKIERRVARPGMHLYDYVVTLFDKDIQILERVDDAVESHAFPYEAILAVRLNEDLLKGVVSLITAEQTFAFSFNTVSEDIIYRMISLLRERVTVAAQTVVEIPESEIPVDYLGVHFSRLLNSERRREPAHVCIAGQREFAVSTQAQSLLFRIWYGVLNKRLFPSLHFCNGTELKVVGKQKLYRYWGLSSYEVDTLYVPIKNIRNVSWRSDEHHAEIAIVQFSVGQEQVEFGFEEANALRAPYASFLESSVGT